MKRSNANAKTIRTAAAVMAAMLAVTACAPMALSVSTESSDADSAASAASASSSPTGKKEDASMKAALTTVKKRIDIPEELTEFTYAESKVYGQTGYNFNWTTPNGAKEYKSINVSIIGGVITEYSRQGFGDDDGFQSRDPKLAKLTQQEVLAKAKESFKKLNPDIYSECNFELRNLSLTSSKARIAISRNVNGIDVSNNGGSIRINQNTGELVNMNLEWWDGAKFSDPKTAKTEAEIQEAFKSLCTLTPYYRISYNWDDESKKSKPTVRIVYSPDFTDEIDAYTGKASTIWEDMKKAGGSRYYGDVMYANPAAGTMNKDIAAGAGVEEALDNDVSFSDEELKKLEQNAKLLKSGDVTALLKKDKFVALTDNYKLKNYNVSSQKDEKGKESFTMYVSYELETDKPAANEYYRYINVNLDAESGKVLSLNKYGDTSETDEFAKLDVKKANAVAEKVAKTYAKDIISRYKADKSNTEPVKPIGTIDVWDNETNTTFEENEYEKSRRFVFNRFENGIQVTNNTIRVTVDSNGVVTRYDFDHAKNITFPKADIISADEAFKKLFEQEKFEKYYDCWITKDGEFKTYLLYDMGSFTLNAKTGKMCNWDGSPRDTSSMSYHIDAKYSDIKDIPQRDAILEMQKYGVTLRTDGKKFLPNTPISEEEFSNLLAELFNEAVAINEENYADDGSPEAKAKAEAAKKDKAETTRREAAVMFAQMYDHNNIAGIKGIFKSFYSDIKSSDENVGHIAIAYAKGFFGKTADGQFHGDTVITRAEAVQLVYDYLKLLSK
ncbi:MAG: S-layer homology domain-containing protein [Oscillospiraceae bacterium]|nr:S-layer homology domain-containing protein [Oscillospiraceae bacterium]